MSKILVAYFSRAGENYFGGAIKSVAVGNTEICADLIKQAFPDADLFKIEMAAPYADNYRKCVSQVTADMMLHKRPALTALPESIAAYDAIVLGYPNYCGTIPMAVASSSPMTVIEGHLEHWGLGHYFKAVISGEHLTRSKPAPDIFLLAAQKLGTEPAKTMVLEDSYNGVRAGAAGGFVTVMVPDLSPATDEMRRIYTCECASLHEVRRKLECGEL